jgi:hypothetical protein
MSKKKKVRKSKVSRREKALRALAIFLLIAVPAGVLFWASIDEDSKLAESIRGMVGLPDPTNQPAEKSDPVTAPTEPEVTEAPPPLPEPEPVEEPPPIRDITIEELAQAPDLWPRTLDLTVSRKITIRYNGNQYGFMEFTPESRMEVVSLNDSGEVAGTINGNSLTILLQNTNFAKWFETTHGDRFKLQPITPVPEAEYPETAPPLSAPGENATFWADLRIWCKQNYDSVSIEVGEDAIVFRWAQKDLTTADYNMEARTIAEKYLRLRIKGGSEENYAACEIRHPDTDALLGASSIFMPQL